ncbi:CDP-diacylglycerol diphosphatase [Orrella marina]|nr:CDP-diacylglycerol diphosphatase [Orrella marina]
MVIALVAIAALWSHPNVHAQTVRCDSTAHEHWYSPVANNLADRAPRECQTCEDPVNAKTPECAVYRTLNTVQCRSGRCTTEQGEFLIDPQRGVALQHSLRYQKPWRFPFDLRRNCWFLLWATDPVIGIEHAQLRDEQNYWHAAFEAATTLIEPKIPADELAMLIQPANRRSQHQLHVHIGRLDPSYRTRLERLAHQSGVITELKINGYHFFVRYLPDVSGQAPLQGHSIFDSVVQMLPAGESSMPLYGILVARSSDATGTWVMAAKGLVRTELVLSTDQACSMNGAG